MIYREISNIAYYFWIQLNQIFIYWIIGILIGSFISVFIKDKIHGSLEKLQGKKIGIIGIFISSALGIASPLCLYGTIPLASSLHQKGIKNDWLAAFMMSSILLNPQLIIYSTALGFKVVIIRIITCYICGITAGLIIHTFFKKDNFFNFNGFNEKYNRDTHPNILIRYIQNIYRNIKATGLWFFLGILLSALFRRYIPTYIITELFGGNEAWGILMAATVGVPLYACGGGTIPILINWLDNGMSLGSATAFMITGPSTKITNLGALKICLGVKHFIYYMLFIMSFSLLSGIIINIAF